MEKAFMEQRTIDYLRENRIEAVVTEAVNAVLAERPADPWATFIRTFAANTKSSLKVTKAAARVVLGSDFKPTLRLTVEATHKNEAGKVTLKMSPIDNESGDSGPLHAALFDSHHPPAKASKCQEALAKINASLNDLLVGRDFYSFESWCGLWQQFGREAPEVSRFLGPAFFFLHFKLLSRFESVQFDDYLSGNKVRRSLVAGQRRLAFYLLAGSGHSGKSCKSVFLTVNGGASELETVKTAVEAIAFVRGELEGNKGLSGKWAPQNGGFTNPFETVADTAKFLSDVAAKFPKRDLIRFVFDMNAAENWDPETQKYTVDGCKKPMAEEEFEDWLVKTFADKKWLQTLLDPFPLANSLSYHRSNKKAQEKGNGFHFGTRRFADYQPEAFKTLTPERFPGVKADVLAKIAENSASLAESWLPPWQFDRLGDFQTALETAAGQGVKVVVSGPQNSCSWNELCWKLADYLGVDVVGFAGDVEGLSALVR